MSQINIAVDGVAGSGKWVSSVRLAQKLGYNYLDTGAMYRVIGLYCKENNIAYTDISEGIFDGVKVGFNEKNQVILNDRNREVDIRTDNGGDLASMYARHPVVRKFLSATQIQMVESRWWVADGRDIGTVIMPDAEVKFFLTASVNIRAERRLKDYLRDGIIKTLEKVTREIEDRDNQDMNREADPLVQLPESIVIDTSHLSIDKQVEEMYAYIQNII